jgi:predicted RND superfamily exporter protein
VALSFQKWVALIDRHRRRLLLGSALLCGLCSLGLTRLRLDMDVLSMLPGGTPAFDDFKSLVEDFGELNELVVLLQGDSATRLQRFADEFGRRLARLEEIESARVRVDLEQVSAGVLGKYLYNYVPEAAYAELAVSHSTAGIAERLSANRALLSAPFDLSAARAVMEDPLGLRRLVLPRLLRAQRVQATASDGYVMASDGRALLLWARPKRSAFDIEFSHSLMERVRKAEAGTRRAMGGDRGTRVSYTGSYVYALEDATTLRRDVGTYTLLALAGVLAVFACGYRSLRIVPLVGYPLVMTTLVTFALSLLLFDQLNAVSLSFAAILYGLSVDAGIHFFTRLVEELKRHDRDPRAAVAATLAAIGRANLVASVTSAAVFLLISLSCLSAVRQLGILTALGMLVSSLQFFTLYPALGLSFARRRGFTRALETPRLGALASWATRHGGAVMMTAALLAIAGATLAVRQVRLDPSLTHLRPADSEALAVQEEIASAFGARAGGAALLVQKQELDEALAESEQLAAVLAKLEQEGMVSGFESAAALLPSAQVQRDRLRRFNELPRDAMVETMRDVLQRQGFRTQTFEPFFAEFRRSRHDLIEIDSEALSPFALLLERHVRMHERTSMVATYFEPAAGVELEAIAARLRADVPKASFKLASRSLLEKELGRILRNELRLFLVAALAGNFLLLLVSFAKVRLALAILVPEVIVLALLFGAMGVSGVAVDPVNLIVIPLLLGLGIDDGIYLVSVARRDGSLVEAMRYGGRAVVLTSLTTIVGFGALGLSRFPALSSMGLLCALALSLCLMASLLVLPAMMALVTRAGR